MERMPLHHSQHLYLAGRSTEAALVQLTDEIHNALTETKVMSAI